MSRAIEPDSGGLRPSAPDQEILNETAVNAGRLAGWPQGAVVAWEVGDRIDRPHSSVFRLSAIDPPGAPLTAYYKVHLPGGEPADRERRQSDVVGILSRAGDLERRLADLVEGRPIFFSQTLVARPESMTHVTRGVDGTPFGSAWQQGLTRARRRQALESLVLVGQAAALIEQCSPPTIPVDEAELRRTRDKRDARLSMLTGDPVLSSLGRRFEEIDAAIDADPEALVYAHSDLSSTNVLVGEWGVGIIDFSWSKRLRGFDVARFAFRIEYETISLRSWAGEMVEALLEGYGDSTLTQSSNWLAIRLPWLLKVVRSGSRSRINGRRASAARAEIEAAL